jgi:hypothetical protein
MRRRDFVSQVAKSAFCRIAQSRRMRWTVPKLYIEEAMMSNTRAATTAAAKPLEFQVMSGSFALVGNQPANYTLATGETEALLVDVPFSRSDAHRVVAAILDSGKKLTTIFVTHDTRITSSVSTC